MMLHFTKMHGLGNDFMIIDGVTQNFKVKRRQIRQWADRHTGVGFDQLLVVEPPFSAKADFFLRIFNRDGSSAEQCGNGARCLGRFVFENRLLLQKTNPTSILVETESGIMHIVIPETGPVSVEMGQPKFHPSEIPFLAEAENPRYALDRGEEHLEFSVASLGNPHAVLLVDDIKDAPVERWGSFLGQHPHFPKGVNVGFMQIIGRNKIALRVYERGVGETHACGTGASAAVAVGQSLKLLDAIVEVMLPGGTLEVKWEGENHPLWLIGPAETVYQGKIRT